MFIKDRRTRLQEAFKILPQPAYASKGEARP